MRKLLFLVPFIFVLMSCDFQGERSFLRVATWNCWLLYDGKHDGHEYPPFDKTDDALYRDRIRLTAEILMEMDADILVLEEIENAKVLEDLIDAGLGRMGFRHYGIAENGRPISVAFLSRRPPVALAVHSSNSFRPFLDVSFRFREERVRIFMLHAKSRLDGGDREREAMFSHVRWLASRSSCPVLIAGDFNEDPRTGPSMRDFRKAPSALPVTGDPGLVKRDRFYAEVLSDPDKETYVFDTDWYAYDHILMNDLLFDGTGLDHHGTEVFSRPDMFDESGFPLRYDAETGRGWSDHLPLVTELRYHE